MATPRSAWNRSTVQRNSLQSLVIQTASNEMMCAGFTPGASDADTGELGSLKASAAVEDWLQGNSSLDGRGCENPPPPGCWYVGTCVPSSLRPETPLPPRCR